MLEQITYPALRNTEQKQVVYQVGDLESLSATALYYGNNGSGFSGGGFGGISKSDIIKHGIIIPANNTEYFKALDSPEQVIGVSHHRTGLGKLKIYDSESDTEYGVTISDILYKSLKDWKIDKK